MARTLFKEVSYSLAKLIEDIGMGEIALPDIQRPFVWENAKVRDLFDSMYKGFPVGYLLFWSSLEPGNHRQIGTDTQRNASRLLIVDGQQRLTSLFAVLRGKPVVREDFSSEKIRIAFRPRDETFAVADAAVRKDPEFIADISQLWAGKRSRNRFVKDFLAQLTASREVGEEEEDHLTEAIDRVYDLQNYPFTALELSHGIDAEQVAEVFVRINSKGKQLNQADFILTLMSVFWDEGRTALERFCREARLPGTGEASPFNHFLHPAPDQMLRVGVALAFRRARLQHVYSLLRGKDLETRKFSAERRDRQFEALQAAQAATLDVQNWQELLKALMRAGYRSHRMITSANALLYTYALFLIGKRDYGVDAYTLREVIARWFFTVAITGRYTSSPETIMEQDLARLREAKGADDFVSVLDRVVHDTLTQDYWNITLPNELATSAARSPSLFAYFAALNVLDARGLFSKLKVVELLDPTLKGRKSPLEKHHLFPKAYLKSIGITERRATNQIANYALVEWSDNIAIADEPPASYLPKYAARFNDDELRQMSHWHALPDGWQDMEYEKFLDVRRRLMAGVIREAFLSLQGQASG